VLGLGCYHLRLLGCVGWVFGMVVVGEFGRIGRRGCGGVVLAFVLVLRIFVVFGRLELPVEKPFLW